MSNVLDDVYKKSEHFFWTMYQKIDSSLSIEQIIERVNKINSKHFKIIENNMETLADPFLFKYGDDMYLFFEKINNQRWNDRSGEGTGEIYCSKLLDLDGKLIYSEPTLVLSKEYHLSYPFLIKDGDNVYMLPEQKQSGQLELYKCISFPNQWESVKILLKGKFVDSTIFYYDNMFWLFTITTDKRNTTFKEQLYYAEKLVTRNWTLHSTINDTDKMSSRRGGGNIFIQNGKIYRPVQCNKDYYGQSVLMLEITKLSKTEYTERPVGILNRNIHTFNMLDNWIVIDSHNKNKNFFEKDYERSVSRWNTKNNRKIMIDKYYKEIGEWLRGRETKNVLDIGINMFNIYNKSYFNNEDIHYYQMDIEVSAEMKKKLESTVIVDNFIGLEKRHPQYIDHFDVIISYGVLSYIEFRPNEIQEYLETASKLLKKDGKLYLKIDKKHMEEKFRKENIVRDEQIVRYFKNLNHQDSLKEDIIIDKEFIFYVLVKK